MHVKRRIIFVASVAWALLCPSPGNSQIFASTKTIDKQEQSVSQKQSLRDVLLKLKEQYQIDIVFDDRVIQNFSVDSSVLNDETSLDKKLEKILDQTGLKFKKTKKDTYLILAPKNNQRARTGSQTSSASYDSGLSFTDEANTIESTPADAITISGIVTAADDSSPLPGVNVIVKGSSVGTTTDGSGRYTLEIPTGEVTLVFSFIGYVTQEVAIGNRTSVDVVLVPDITTLNEVVVVGYGTQEKQDLVTAVSSVDNKALSRQIVAGLDQALQGQTPGVQVTSPSGAPGSGINVQVRGNNSISLTNSPLYIIDGVPIMPAYESEVGVGNQRPNPLNAINPNDIERIDVLKDGAAAAIYGLRAANGVVVVTTKRGKKGKAEVDFSSYIGRQEIRRKLDVLTGPEFARYFNTARINAGQAAPFANPDEVPTTNWQDLMYRTAVIQNYQLSFRGGSENTQYYASAGYFNQEGILINSGFERFSFKVNLDQTISKRIRFGTSLNLSKTNNNRSPVGETSAEKGGMIISALAQIPSISAVLPDGTYGANPFVNFDNPYGALVETQSALGINQFIGNVYGEADILPGLTFRSNVALDYRSQLETQYQTRKHPTFRTVDSPARGSARLGNQQQTIWLWENTLTYKPQLAAVHDLTLLLGQSVQESDRFTSGSSQRGFSSDASPYIGQGSIQGKPYSYQDQWALSSLFLRAIYNYDQKYLLTLSLRRDGTSRFAKDNRFGYFPAVGLGWRISEESFFPETQTFSNLKLRASYGVNGNQEIYTYGRFSTYTAGYLYPGLDGSFIGGIAPGSIGNEDLKWETTVQYNAGIDVGLFEDRIGLTFDAYIKRTNDLLTSVPVPISVGINPEGFGTVLKNLGTIENRGIELGINSTNMQRDNGFSWTTNVNLTMNRNKVVSLGGIRSEQGREEVLLNGYTTTRVGHPLGSFYGWIADGIFNSTDEIAAAPTQANAQPGDIRFRDTNSDGVINDNDRVIIGNPNPDLIAGLTNNFSYKDFELSIFFQGSFGNDIYNENRATIEGMHGPFNQTTNVLNHWTPENTNTDMPRPVEGDPNWNRRFSTRFLEDGTYVRLKNISLSYNFSNHIRKFVTMSNLRLYVSAQNLITWTNYSGYDPEVSADPFSSVGFGRDFGVYPQSRTYTIGINATF